MLALLARRIFLLVFVLAVYSLNVVGDGIPERLDPWLRDA
jgi:hypothetical protein